MEEDKRLTGQQIREAIDRELGKKPPPGDRQLYCSFCGKEEREVSKLIAGPSAFICNECVFKSVQILRDLGIDD